MSPFHRKLILCQAAGIQKVLPSDIGRHLRSPLLEEGLEDSVHCRLSTHQGLRLFHLQRCLSIGAGVKDQGLYGGLMLL